MKIESLERKIKYGRLDQAIEIFNEGNEVGLEASSIHIPSTNGDRGRFAVSIIRPHNGNSTGDVITRTCTHRGGTPEQLRLINYNQDMPYAKILGERFFSNKFVYPPSGNGTSFKIDPDYVPHHHDEIAIGITISRPNNKPLMNNSFRKRKMGF